MKKYEQLIQVIEYHNKLYYVDDNPTLSDSEYDSLMAELEEMEKENPDLIVPYSPTQKVNGNVRKGFSKIKIEKPMLSLKDIFDESEFLKWDAGIRKKLGVKKSVEYCCELKLDGMALEVRYNDKLLTTACSRGDGNIGEDLTLNAMAISNLPIRLMSLPKRKTLVGKDLTIRGEVVLTYSGLAQINERIARDTPNKKQFANVRNAAAGTMRQLNPAVVSERDILFMAYSAVGEENEQFEQLKQLARLGIATSPHTELAYGKDGVLTYYEKIQDIRDSLNFAIDGIVIKVNDPELRTELGELTNVPNWAVAFKFPPQVETSSITDVVFQVGRMGTITPVAKIKPIEILGSVISSVTLHNQDEFNRYDLHEDDIVSVIKAGDVIPAITKVFKENRREDAIKYSFPTECPSCQSELVRDKSSTLCVAGSSCPAQRIRVFEHFVSRAAMNIEGMAVATITELIEHFDMSEQNEIYYLTKEDLSAKTTLGPKEIDNLLAAIERSRDVSLAAFIYSLGISNVGTSTSAIVAEHIETVDKLWTLTEATLLALQDIGPITATSIMQFLENEKTSSFVKKLLLEVRPVQVSANVEKTYSGMKVVVTGSFENYTRDDITKWFTDRGAKLSKTVSKKTDLVLVGNNPGTSFLKAKELKLTIISELPK